MSKSSDSLRSKLNKTPSGISGLDEITDGGLPKGRPTLVCGGPGSGKTLVGLSFLVNGARRYGEAGVLLSFEESADDLAFDVASLGFDLPGLAAEGKLFVDYVHIDAARSRRRASTTWRACSSGSTMRCKAWVPSGWCSIR
jgi:circadian clock protein KaiC